MINFTPTTALIVVDVQNDFAHPDGSLFVPGAPSVMPVINATVQSAMGAGSLVVRTQDWHPAVTPHFASAGGIWPDHCVSGTWGAEFHDGLVASGGEDGYSGFTVKDPESGVTTRTELAGVLKAAGVTDIVVVGLATDYCVAATAVDGAELGFATSVLADGVSAVDLSPGDGARAIVRMVEAGVTII